MLGTGSSLECPEQLSGNAVRRRPRSHGGTAPPQPNALLSSGQLLAAPRSRSTVPCSAAADNTTFTPRRQEFTLKTTPKAPLTPQPEQRGQPAPSNCCYVQHGGRHQGRAQASGREAGTTVRTRGCPPQ